MKSNIFKLKSIKSRVTLFTLAIFLISIWSLAIYASRMLHEEMKQLSADQQFSAVSFMASAINEELETRLRSLELLASEIKPAMMENAPSLQKLLEQSQTLQVLYNGGVFVTRSDGTAIADVPLSAGRVGVNYMDRTSISVPIKEGKSMIGRPAMGKKLAAPIFSITVPIKDTQGRVIGVVAGTVNLNRPSFLDKLTNNRYGKTGGYLLVAPQHRLIVTATDKRHVMTSLPPSGADRLIDSFVQGYEGDGISVNPLGVEVLTSAKRVPVAGWYVSAALPTTEAFAPIYDMHRSILQAATLLTLLAGGLTWWMLKRQLAPMFATLSMLAALSESDEPLTPLSIMRQDEIGELIGGFNRLLEIIREREELLKESEVLFRTLANYAPIGIFRTDSAGNFTYVNKRCGELSGFTETESMGIGWVMALHSEDRDKVITKWNNAVQANGLFEMEFRIKTPSGRISWVRCVATSLPTVSSEISGYIGCVSDITESKLAVNALRDSEAKYRFTLDSMLEGCQIIGFDWKYLYINSAAEKQNRRPSAELLGRTVMECWPGITETHFFALEKSCMAERTIQKLDNEFTFPDGHTGWFRLIFQPVPEGMAIYSEDITKRKLAEIALKNSEERYRRLFEMDSDSLLVLDIENGIFIDANTAAVGMYGHTQAEFLCLKPVDISANPVEAERSMRDKETFVSMCWHRKKDGMVFPVEIASSYFEYQGRQVLVAAIRDITERLHTQKLLSDLNQRLSDLNEHLLMVQEQERISIARDIHDDLGQSLTVLKLDLEMIELRIPADSNELAKSVINMRKGIDQITSKIQQIAADLRPPLLDNLGLAAAIGWQINEIRNRCGIEFFVMLNDDAVSLDLKISTVVMRIVQEGLTNIIRHAEATEVSVSLCKRGGNLFLEISDNGCGITSEQISSPKSYGLMGMYERARSCRGELEIIKNPEGGTTLSLSIPLDTGGSTV